MASKIYSTYFFFIPWIRKAFWDPFWWIILFAIILWIPFLRPWWWFFLPVMLAVQLKELYLWWIMWDFTYAKFKWVVIEMIPPKEVLAPFKAMEDVFTSLWPIYDFGNWRERWCEGEFGESAYWFSWEIVSAEGVVHFYFRCLAQFRRNIETILYGHYPEIEIREVPDYFKNLPQDVPNKEWDLYGEDWILGNPDCYPIRTYEKFFEPQGEKISAEEKRLDPIASLLEGLSKLGPGEHFWMQFITTPVLDKEVGLMALAKKEIDKIARRPVKHEKTLLEDVGEMLHHLIMGPTKEGSGEKATYKFLPRVMEDEGEDNELLLTPGEKEKLTGIEDKIKKPIYKCSVRATYCAKREVWKGASKNTGRGYFGHFTTLHLNGLRYTGDTRPKTHYLFRRRRAYFRARKMFRNSVARFPALYPDMHKYTILLNPEELATLFHFPNKITGLVSPTVARVESKKAGPPPNLPV